MGGSKTEMSVWQLQVGIPWQAAQAVHTDVREHLLKQLPMPGTAHTIQHDASKIEAWIQISETSDQCAERPGLPTSIHHQHHWKAQAHSYIGSTPFGAGSNAVEQAHHALNQGHVTTPSISVEAELHPVHAAKRKVKVSAGLVRR